MPTDKDRLTLALPTELSTVLKALGRLQGRPKSGIVVDLLVGALPALQGMARALELAQQDKPREAHNLMAEVLGSGVKEAVQTGFGFKPRRKRRRPR